MADEPTEWMTPPALEVAWRIDGSAPGRELLLPSSATLSTAASRLAVVDFQLGEVIVVSLDGDWIGRWGRRGEGPGEIGYALAARWVSGPLLEVYDPANSKVVQFDTAGVALGERAVSSRFTAALGGGVAWLGFGDAGSLLAQPVAHEPEEAEHVAFVIVRTGASGSVVDTVAVSEIPAVSARGWTSIAAPGYALPHAAESAAGVLAIAGDIPEYRITLASANGQRKHICRTVRPQPLSEEERVPEEEPPPALRAALAAAPVPDIPGSISRVAFDAAERLWVQRDRPRILNVADVAIGREGALFDVYRGDRYLGEFRMPDRVRFLASTHDLVVGLHRDSLDVYSIVAYRPAW